jgi:hypothetical protein
MAHGLEGGFEDTKAIDVVGRDGDEGVVESVLFDDGDEVLSLIGGKSFGVFEPIKFFGRNVGGEDHSSGDYWTGEGTTTDFVNTGDMGVA